MPSRAQRRAKKRAQHAASGAAQDVDHLAPPLSGSDPASPPPQAAASTSTPSPLPDAATESPAPAAAADEPVSRAEFMRLRAELEEMRTKHSATLAAHDAAMSKKLNEIGLLSSQVEKFRADVTALQDELQRAVARAQIAKAVEQRRKASEAALQQQLEATQAELAEALVAGAGSLQHIEGALHVANTKQTAEHHSAAQRMGTFEEQMQSLRASVSSGAAERQTLLAALATAERRVEALTAEKADLEVRLSAPLKTPLANGPSPIIASPGGSPITPERLSFSPELHSRALAVAPSAPSKGPLAALVDFVRRALAHVIALFSPPRPAGPTTPLLA